MDTTLVTVTLLSMAMAASLSVIVWRMLRDERRRSDARVIALTATRTRDQGTRDQGTSDLPLREAPVSARVSTAALFAERKVASPWGPRFAVMAGLGLVVASVILFALTATGKAAATRQAGRTAVTAAAAETGTTPGGAGLELLSLRDTRQPGSLTITGLVQNPRGGAPLSRVTVTAYAFDDNGAFLASGRALIDVTALSPGDESPFVVSVPVTETVARYRIGFRGEDGRVIAHIDKRQQASVAALDIPR
jgi:hypothetical protein